MQLYNSIKIADTLFVQEVDNEMVILDTASQQYFGLDEMGVVIWKHLNESTSLQKVYNTMCEVYEVDTKQLEEDICRFVQELVDVDLIQVV